MPYPLQPDSGIIAALQGGSHHEQSYRGILGTFTLVLVGCGAAVISGMGSGATSIDALGIGAAFGLALVAMAYGIGQISGCHINPAVSVGVWAAGRMTTADLITYAIAQVLGAITAAVVLYLNLSGKASGWTPGALGQNGWGAGYLGEYNTTSASLYEVIATFLSWSASLAPRNAARRSGSQDSRSASR